MHVRLISVQDAVSVMTPEQLVTFCARVSNPENQWNHETSGRLLRYLIDFENAFSLATASRHPHARYYLRVLERQEAGEDEPEFVPNASEEAVTLEHVLPQNPDNDWKHFDQETANRYYKRIGNLALMKKSKNEAGGNATFADKAKLYGKSEFKLTSGLIAFAEDKQWTFGAINKRQKMMAKLAVEAWPNKVL